MGFGALQWVSECHGWFRLVSVSLGESGRVSAVLCGLRRSRPLQVRARGIRLGLEGSD